MLNAGSVISNPRSVSSHTETPHLKYPTTTFQILGLCPHKPIINRCTFTIFIPMINPLLSTNRNSQMALGSAYFWTSTILDWKHLFKQEKYKTIIIESMKYLVDMGLVKVYGFVIMPNHVHILWIPLKLNGKEMPHASFNKYTAHAITKELKELHPKVLQLFEVQEKERSHRIWQRDPLAILMDSKSKLEQKLDYIHNNPLHKNWNLATRPEDYRWSSAQFYEKGIDEFGFLTHYRDDF